MPQVGKAETGSIMNSISIDLFVNVDEEVRPYDGPHEIEGPHLTPPVRAARLRSCNLMDILGG